MMQAFWGICQINEDTKPKHNLQTFIRSEVIQNTTIGILSCMLTHMVSYIARNCILRKK